MEGITSGLFPVTLWEAAPDLINIWHSSLYWCQVKESFRLLSCHLYKWVLGHWLSYSVFCKPFFKIQRKQGPVLLLQDYLQNVNEMGLYLTVFGFSFSWLLNDFDLYMRELGITVDRKLEQPWPAKSFGFLHVVHYLCYPVFPPKHGHNTFFTQPLWNFSWGLTVPEWMNSTIKSWSHEKHAVIQRQNAQLRYFHFTGLIGTDNVAAD